MTEASPYIRQGLEKKFEFYSHGHALEILYKAFLKEWGEIQDCLGQLTISIEELQAAGETKRQSRKSLTTRFTQKGGGKSGLPGIWW